MLSLLLLLQAAIGGRAGPAYDSVVVDGIRRGAYPGAALVIGTRDSILYARGYGHLTWNPRSPLVDPDSTLYDLASVTKVLATTTALMILVERGAVRLDAPVVTYVPAFTGAGTEAITVRQLLAHTSGLRADLPTTEIKAAPDGAALLRLVHAETPRVAPGTRVVYSDLNAILLGEIVARAGGKPLDEFVSQEVLGPLQLAETMYRPPARRRGRTAPTGVWHGVPVAGVVNDPSAAKLGGVAGNAGLFSTGRDVARFAQFILRGGSLPGGGRLVRRATIQEFTTKVAPTGSRGERRALGWQATPTGEETSSAGSALGPRTIGHTGWTGTSLWIDPDRDVFVVLLTNRAFAPRARRPFTELKRVRGALADAVARAHDGVAAAPGAR